MKLTKSTIYTILFTTAFGLVFSSPAFAANSSIFTIEAWVMPTTSIATKAVVAKAEEMRMVTDASGNPVCQINNSATWQTAATSSLAISIDTWSHIACSYDKVSLKVFVNGVEKGSTALTVAVDDTAADLKLGTDDSSDAVYEEFAGKIDDVRFYNYARSAKQIIQDLNAGHPAVGSPVGSQVGYWKFDEGYGDTANDSSPYDNDGDLAGSCPGADTCPSWTNSGKFGKALSFDGGDYIDCGAGSSLNITDAITISAWVKSTMASTGSVIQRYKDSGSYEGYELIFSGTTAGKFNFYTDNGGWSNDLNSTLCNDGNWHHIAITGSGASGIIYIDGSSDGIFTYAASSSILGENFFIGSTEGIASFFTGAIDSVKIYNYALTEDEVRVEYNQGKAIVLGATGTESDGTTPSFSANREYCVPGDTTSCNPPVAEWNFNEQTGSSAYDTSSNNNTGTITNATWTPEGKFGSALSFDGDGDYVNCGNHSSLNLATAITIESWIRPNVIEQVNRPWFNKWSGLLTRITSSWETNVYYYLLIGGGIQEGSTGFALTANRWNHLVETYDSSTHLLKFYLDGVEKYSTAMPSPYTLDDHSAVDFHIGKYIAEYFNGTIDGVKIYDYARTPAQVAWSYNRGKPVAEWRFDECQGNIAHDESGNGNNGTITIGANAPQTSVGTCTDGLSTSAWYNGRNGKINSALSLDGDDDYVDCGSGSTLNITDAITLSAWVKLSALNVWQQIASKSTSGDAGYWLRISDTNKICFNAIPAVDTAEVLGDTTLSSDIWYHFIGTYDGTTRKIYLNGKLDGSSTAVSGSILNAVETLDVGRRTDVSEQYLTGLIDEVKIYNYALTAEQIKMEYNSGAVNFK